MAKKRNSTGQALPVGNGNYKGQNGTTEGQATSSENVPPAPGLTLGIQLKQYLGKTSIDMIPGFPNLELNTEDLPEDCDPNSGAEFEDCYRKHCLQVLEAVTELNLPRYVTDHL